MISTKKNGRPEITLTAEQETLIEELAARRVPMRLIATSVGMGETTLRTRFKGLIELGWAKADAEVYGAIFEQCLAGNTKMLILYSKWHLGFKEPTREIHATIDPEQLLADIREAEAATIIPPPVQNEE
jgi:hypothetical protein